MKFIFIRHGETHANVEKRIYGVSHSPFTENGLRQVDFILNYIEKQPVNRIYTSPMERTQVIACEIMKRLGVHLEIEDALSEMNYGIFEGLTPDEVMDKYPKEYVLFMKEYKEYIIPSGENFMDFDQRVITFLDKIKEEEGTCICVTHGGVMRTAIMHLLNLSSEDRWHFKIVPGMIMELDYSKDYGRLLQMVTSPDMTIG